MNDFKKHEIKIYYNPFLKKIEVERLTDKDEWKKWDEDHNVKWNTSPDSSLQNVVMVLLREINDKYNTGKNGMRIEFFGTSSDFADLKDALARLEKEFELTGDIELDHNKEDVLLIGEEVKKEVDSHYEKMKEIIDSSNMESVKEKVAKYKDVSKPIIKVCIIGNYSTGKSTFLNAIIGREVLPSDTDPTTAKNVKISHSEEMSINFRYDAEEVSIIWDSNTHKHRYSEAGATDFKKMLDESVAKESDKYRQVNIILKKMNEVSDEKLSPDVELRLPFINDFFAMSAVEFVFIDTPGSNAAAKMSEKHKEILNSALKDQTSALPVILVERNSLFSKDNKELNDTLQKDGIELDVPNKLFLINMADKMNVPSLKGDSSKDTLKKVLKEKGIDCVIYFSALIALGAQTDLHDASYKSDYKTFKSRFSDEENEDFRNLEEYAILPDLLADLRKSPDNCGERHNFLKNSGMLLFQRMLDNFAKKYSYCSKAEACRKLLLEAIEDVKQEQEKESAKYEKIAKEYKDKRESKKNELLKKINEKPDFEKEYSKIVDEAKEKFAEPIKKFSESLLEKVKMEKDKSEGYDIKTAILIKLLMSSNGEDSKQKKAERIHKNMVEFCNNEYEKLFNEAKAFYEGKFNILAEDYKRSIISIIDSDEELSEETKKRLICINKIAPNFSAEFNKYKNDKKVVSRRILCFGGKIKPEGYTKMLKNEFESKFNTECVENTRENFKETLEKWATDLAKKYESSIDEKNIVLIKYQQKIEECESKVKDIGKIRKDLEESKVKLEKITSFKRNFKKEGHHE